MTLHHEQTLDGFTYSTDKSKLDVDYIYTYLAQRSYWAEGIPYSIVRTSIENSLCFGIYEGTKQAGFARFITDYATFGYLADVFIDEAYRGRGLSKNLVGFIFGLEALSKLRRVVLVTRDAHTLYAREGFTQLNTPDYYMELRRQDIYKTFTPKL